MSPSVAPIDRLLAIMRQLRNPEGGCEWDLAQDFQSIASYTIEEAYEVSDAIAGGQPAAICDELGDLLLQVVFHSQIAEDQGLFDFNQVANTISDKMERRHPHIFGDVTTDDVHEQWERIKADERESKAETNSALSGVALALPALMRAQKLQGRAARTGFDWPDATGPRDKIDEELTEISEANDVEHRHEEVGDLLFAVVNYARHLGIDAETALRDANNKFARRFAAMEIIAGGSLDDLNLVAQEQLWQDVKANEHRATTDETGPNRSGPA